MRDRRNDTLDHIVAVSGDSPANNGMELARTAHAYSSGRRVCRARRPLSCMALRTSEVTGNRLIAVSGNRCWKGVAQCQTYQKRP